MLADSATTILLRTGPGDAVTVSVALPERLPFVALMVVVPARRVVIEPELEIAATVGEEDDQTTGPADTGTLN